MKELLNEKLKTFLLPILIFIGALIFIGIFISLNQKDIGSLFEKTLSEKEAGDKVISYLNENVLSEGFTASLLEITKEKQVYKLRLKIGETEYNSFVTTNGRFLFPEGIDLDEFSESQSEEEPQEKIYTIGDFSVSSDEVCLEQEKPVIYFFGSESCPHCVWEHPVVDEVAGKFDGYISFHNNMDSDADAEVFSKYSAGSIPTLVLGCRYYRVGSGEREGREAETSYLTALICKLTQGQPADVCQQVEDLISQID